MSKKSAAAKPSVQQGGAFLVEEAGRGPIFIPEDLSIEQKELAKTVHDFVANEVLSKEELIEAQQPGLMPKLLKEAAKLGFLMAEMPEAYGGLGLGKIEAAAMAEGSILQGSFNVSYMCHTGIATAPLVYYGTKEQKEKYLPKLATGELIGAFALTEPEAGSDAMAITTKAVLSPDKKHYILNGRKQFITNGGFANFFTVFAKCGEKGITAFLVEKGEGFSTGREEKKMGIHGTSTVPLIFENVKVPVENLLGEVGKGHHIAFNVLNLGRLKLGAACVGASRHLINLSYNYGNERKQFGQPLTSFQMIQEKLATMVSKTLLLESMIFRLAHNVDETLKFYGDAGDVQKGLREHAVEAAVAKVYGSETLYQIADETMQLYGGYGYCEDYGIERFFRDARINRIYEGTNEINRLVITGTVLRMAAKGEIDIFTVLGEAPKKIKELITGVDDDSMESKVFATVEVLKRLILMIGGGAVQRYMKEIGDEQFILSGLADMIAELYALESGYMRVMKLKADGKQVKADFLLNGLYYYLLKFGTGIFEKGRQTLMHIMPADAKEVDSYTKAMVGCQNFIRGDLQGLTMALMDELNNMNGYPF